MQRIRPGVKHILRFKPGHDYGAFGFFEASSIPARRCFGYERELDAGIRLCKEVLSGRGRTAYVLVFGIPGTGKTLYPCTLASRYNSTEQRFSIAFLQCSPEYWTEKLVKEIPSFIDFIRRRTPLIVHLVEVSALGKSFENGDSSESFVRTQLFRWLRVLFSEEPENSLIVATTTFPDFTDPVLLGRFDTYVYIRPTDERCINEIIAEILNRSDSQEIAAKLVRYFSEFNPQMVPLGRDVLRASRLLRRQRQDVPSMSPDEIAVLLKRFISPFPMSKIKEYEKEQGLYIEKSLMQITSLSARS